MIGTDFYMNNNMTAATKDLLFLPLGGCGEIGMNLNLYGYDQKWLMVDLGVTFTNELGIEVMMPDPQYIVDRRKDLMGLILTHAHEDHIGAVPHLWERLQCPIYATPFTAHLVREKLKEAGLLKRVTIHEVPLSGLINLDPFRIQFINLTHSIPEPNAIAIETPAGVIMHTGDWKVDDLPLVGESSDVDKLKAFGDRGVLALVCDSTNVFVPGRTGSESTVRTAMIDLVKRQKNRVVVACFASNVARLETAAIAAQQAGRKVALIGRSMYRMEQAARACGYLKDLEPFVPEEEIKNIPAHEILIISTGSQGEPRSALSRIAMRQHPNLKLQSDDTVIFSSRIIPGNEDEIHNLKDMLIDQGVIIVNDADADVHVSGHPSREDLKLMYQWIRPQIIVPVHGENAHIREHAAFARAQGVPKAIQPRNGTLIRLNADRLDIIEEVPAGRLVIDGHMIVPRTNNQLRDRHRLMESGCVFITILTNRQGDIKIKPEITFMGVVEDGGESKMTQLLHKDLQIAIQKQLKSSKLDHYALKDLVRLTVRRTINAQRGKKPSVITHIIKI